MLARSFTVYDMLLRNSRIFGDRCAIIDAGQTLTFEQLRKRVERLAAGLSRAGLGTGDRLCVLARNSSAFIELYLAAARQGIVVYPLNWRWTELEVGPLIERAAPRAIATSAEFAGLLAEVPAHEMIRIQMDGEAMEGFLPLADLYAAHAPPARAVLADEAFAIIPTAAVEAIPRGAILSHRNVLVSNLQQMHAMGLGDHTVNLLALPLFHIAGLGTCLATLHAGGANVVMPGFDADEAVRLIDEHGVTFTFDFPPVLANLLDAAARSGSRLESLSIVCGIDAAETIERLHGASGADFWTGFGQTETAGFVTLQRAREKSACAGRAAALTEIRLLGDDDCAVATGECGEIAVRGPVVFLGYDAEPAVTARTLRGGWHHTGDVGRFDAAGYLHYEGRKPEKDLIKSGGENVYPAEVESAIAEMPGVTGVCVFGAPDPTWGEAVRAAVETADPALTGAAVIEHVGSRIARYKRPQQVVLVERLPRTAGGAVDRVAVKKSFA